MSSWSSTEEGISVYFVVFASLLALVLVLSKLLHDRPLVASFLPEAGMILLVGMTAGFFVSLVKGPSNDDDQDDDIAESLLSFDPKVFFIALLPPIIFNSGYHLRRQLFVRHFTPICLFAFLGTLLSAVTVALLLQIVVQLHWTGSFTPTLTELLTFGALISATDPVSTLAVFQTRKVDPQLFYLVFGESVLNDAVGLVLYRSFKKFVQRDNGFGKVAVGILELLVDSVVEFGGSLLLGFLTGILAAWLLKTIDLRRNTLLELSLYILIMYVPYLLAEIVNLSGIVTILCSGIAARRYMVPNLSESTQQNAETFFRLAAHTAESSIFLELGLSVFARAGKFQWRFVLWSILACLIGRAFNVIPITVFFNRSVVNTLEQSGLDDFIEMRDCSGGMDGTNGAASERCNNDDAPVGEDDGGTSEKYRSLKITPNTATMLWFSGLRGAVAYACVRTFPNTFGHQTEFIVTTMVIVLFTVFALGGTTELMLGLLKIDADVDEEEYMKSCSRDNLQGGMFHNFERLYIRRNVIRDFHSLDKSQHDGPAILPDPQPLYQEHVEVTEDMNEDATKEKGPKKKSLYDYGSH